MSTTLSGLIAGMVHGRLFGGIFGTFTLWRDSYWYAAAIQGGTSPAHSIQDANELIISDAGWSMACIT